MSIPKFTQRFGSFARATEVLKGLPNKTPLVTARDRLSIKDASELLSGPLSGQAMKKGPSQRPIGVAHAEITPTKGGADKFNALTFSNHWNDIYKAPLEGSGSAKEHVWRTPELRRFTLQGPDRGFQLEALEEGLLGNKFQGKVLAPGTRVEFEIPPEWHFKGSHEYPIIVRAGGETFKTDTRRLDLSRIIPSEPVVFRGLYDHMVEYQYFMTGTKRPGPWATVEKGGDIYTI